MSGELQLSCPLCAGRNLTSLNEAISRCERCQLAFQNQPPADPLGLYRRAEYDKRRVSNPAGGPTVPSWSRFYHDCTIAQLRLEQIMQALPPRESRDQYRIVDFGCGNGAFLDMARRQSYKVTGVELDPYFCEEVRTVLGVPVVSTAEFLEAPWNYPSYTVTMFDVLEHLVSPVSIVRSLATAVGRNGCLVIEVPDLGACKSIDSWEHAKCDEHLTHWSSPAFEQLLTLHLPHFRKLSESRPVPGKLQVIYRRHRD